MADEGQQPIVIKRIAAGHGHHGGGWKVAFADFATAMMAFFLLMWLMGATTADQRGGVSQYFKNPSVVQGASPLPSPSAMQGPGGSSTAMIQAGGGMELFKEPHKDETVGRENVLCTAGSKDADADVASMEAAHGAVGDSSVKEDEKRLQSLMLNLNDAVEQKASLKPFSDQVLMDVTAEGLRIQVIDKETSSMFASGSAQLVPFSTALLHELATIIRTVPNRISISGHTDSNAFNKNGYGNWELSADRANAARRALIEGGVPEEKIGRVVGLSSFAPLDPEHPDSPLNRRISIIVLNARTENAIRVGGGALFSVQTNTDTP
jgi:chemotaxis protein MotB